MPDHESHQTSSTGSKTGIIGLITARGGSKGIPRKNLVLLGGKPLIQYTFEAALGSKVLDRVILSTDNLEIAELGRKSGIEVPFIRPASLATDNASTRSVQKHAVQWLEQHEHYVAEAVVTLQPTSPLRQSYHIDEAVNEFRSRKVDSVIGVTNVENHPYDVVGFDDTRMYRAIERPVGITRRQDYPAFYYIHGAIFVNSREIILNQARGDGDHVFGYEMDAASSLDIDTPFDLQIAACLLENSAFRAR